MPSKMYIQLETALDQHVAGRFIGIITV